MVQCGYGFPVVPTACNSHLYLGRRYGHGGRDSDPQHNYDQQRRYFHDNGFSLTPSSFTNGGNFEFKGFETISTVPNNLVGSTVTFANSTGTVHIPVWTYHNVVINAAAPSSLVETTSVFTFDNITLISGIFETLSVATINGNVVAYSGGKLNFEAGTSVAGNWTVLPGGLNASSVGITFNGTGVQSVTSGGQPFQQVVVNGSGNTLLLNDSLSVSSLTLTNGTVDGCRPTASP